MNTRPSTDYAMQMQAQQSLIDTLRGFDRAIDAHWGRWYPKAREWYAVHAGDSWEPEAKMELEAKGKNPVEMNRVDAMVSAISGAEITNRQTVRYAPREIGDVKVNELFTGAVEWSRDTCDAADEESQAFRDTLICGLGPIETRMDYLDDEEGMAKIERCDPLEFGIDPSARKSNFVDADYFRRKRRFPKKIAYVLFPQLCQAAGLPSGMSGDHENVPGRPYGGGDNFEADAPLPPDVVEIIEYQFRDIEEVVLVMDPGTQQRMTLGPAELQRLATVGIDPVRLLNGVRSKRWVWKRAFRAGDMCFEEPLPDGEFTYKFVTGKIDRNTGLPYGVVRAMVDPQRWSNKFLSQIDYIISSNAKGGIIYESDAFEDPRDAEERWAQSDSMIATKAGAVRGGMIMAKPQQPYPQGLDRLFQIASSALPEVVGVNKEMLGMADQAQAGVLEYQRKQAAYGVLSIFFDSLKRYRKLQGRLHLKLISKYMSDGRIVRITNADSGKMQYVQLMHDPNTLKFDVIVDEAPQGPNQKERVWQMLLGLGGVMQSLNGLPPEMILSIMEYSPLPSSLIDKLRNMLQQQQNDPQMQQQQQLAQQVQMGTAVATLQKLQAEVGLTQAKAEREKAQAQAALRPDPTAGQTGAPDQTTIIKLQNDHQTNTAKLMLQGRQIDLQAQQFQIDSMLRLHDIDSRTAVAEATLHANLIDGEEERGARTGVAVMNARAKLHADSVRADVANAATQSRERVAGRSAAEKVRGEGESRVDAAAQHGLAAAFEKLAEALMAETEIVRDPQTGRPVGSRKVVRAAEAEA